MKALSFNTETYSKHQRHDAWREVLSELCLQSDPPHIADERFFGSVARLVSPLGIRFARIASSPQEIACRAHDKSDALWMVLLLEGRATVSDGTKAIRLSPGDIAYGPTRGGSTLTLETDFRLLMVQMPEIVVAPRLLGPRSLLGATFVSGKRGVGQVFAGLLRSIADSIESLTAEQIQPVELALSEFLVASMARDAASQAKGGASGWQVALIQRICQTIDTRLSDPDLSMAQIAVEHGISTRYLQKLFHSVHESFAHYLRNRRLERCRTDLVNPLYAQLSISDICFRWGFSDSAHFSRTFRKQFGVSPREWRARSGERTGEGEAAGTSRGWPDMAAARPKPNEARTALEPDG
ncbi:MAG: helix-turn-helix domain-containing protein, partial [Rhodospirillaceae bacterium]|nr:helix-turn-helix domain-containing protein [Rhodospirillaceae bacterium]